MVYYRLYKSPPLVPILSHVNPVYGFSSRCLDIYFNIILACRPTVFKLLFPSSFSATTLYVFLFWPKCATQHVHFILRDLITRRVQVMQLFLMQFHLACRYFLLKPTHIRVQPIIEHTQHVFFFSMKDQFSQKYTGIVSQVIKITPKLWVFHWNISHSLTVYLEDPLSVFSTHPRRILRNGFFFRSRFSN